MPKMVYLSQVARRRPSRRPAGSPRTQGGLFRPRACSSCRAGCQERGLGERDRDSVVPVWGGGLLEEALLPLRRGWGFWWKWD